MDFTSDDIWNEINKKVNYKDADFEITQKDALYLNENADKYKFLYIKHEYVNYDKVKYKIKIESLSKMKYEEKYIEKEIKEENERQNIIVSSIEECIHIFMEEELNYINNDEHCLPQESGRFYYKIPNKKYIIIEHMNNFDHDFGAIYPSNKIQYDDNVIILNYSDGDYEKKLEEVYSDDKYICTYYEIPEEYKNIKYHKTLKGQTFDKRCDKKKE